MRLWKRFGVYVLACVLTGVAWSAPALSAPVRAAEGEAQEVKITVAAEDGKKLAKLTDGSYSTTASFPAETTLTVAAAGPEEKIYGLYIAWAAIPGPWTLSCGGTVFHSDTNNPFLHEYVQVEGGSGSVELTLEQDESICYIKAYGEGDLPGDVQVWSPPCYQSRADILLFSTHADDEILFFGGILPEYAGERGLRTQVVYFSNYFTGTVVREHEKLDGLWAAGVRNYPVNASFQDVYTNNLKHAKQVYDYDGALSFLVEQIRAFRPQICVAQDAGGEYGHGTHMLTSALMQEAVTVSMDPERFPESAQAYGAWDVPKTYLHLWKENPIVLDCRKPLDAFGGQTALEVATAAYKKHVSQQWCWFYVSDTYKYSIAEFGLFRTTVGTDTGGDMMEHLTSYAEQERLEAERKAEAERRAREEAERRAREEAERRAQEEAERRAQEEAAAQQAQAGSGLPVPIEAIVGGAALLICAGLWIWRRKH